MARVNYIDLPAKHAPLRERLSEVLERVLAHGQFVLGPEVSELEERLASYLGVKAVVTCGSGTDALVLALRLRGIGPGDEVITTAHSFIATGNAILLVGATPVFVDIDEDTMVLDAALVAEALTERTKAILPVHLNGFPMNTEPLAELCTARGIALIEDCAQAFGSRRNGQGVGGRDLGCFSFHPLKIFSACGDGGCVTVASESDAETLRKLRNHGLQDRDHSAFAGFNSRLDSIQAGFLLVKLDVVDEYIAARQAHAARYHSALAGLVALPPSEPTLRCNHSAFAIRHPKRDTLRLALASAGVDSKVHYPLAMHQQPAFVGDGNVSLPVTERVVGEILSLPVSAELTDAEQEQVVVAIKEALTSGASARES